MAAMMFIATKVNMWQVNNHVGPGVAIGYARKVIDLV